MSRSDADLLDDIGIAITAIHAHFRPDWRAPTGSAAVVLVERDGLGVGWPAAVEVHAGYVEPGHLASLLDREIGGTCSVMLGLSLKFCDTIPTPESFLGLLLL
jgi:hypothetical protein